MKLVLLAISTVATRAAFSTLSSFPSPEGNPTPGPQPDFTWKAPTPHDARPAPNGDTTEPTTTTATILGCTDSVACNYNSLANTNDASCTYAKPLEKCDGTCLDSSPADCAGICGGSTVCCPATCTFVKGQTLTCDAVANQLGETTSETCTTLENFGCNCDGCGCGIVVDADGYEIPDGMEASGLTCDKSLKVSQPCTAVNTCTAHECKTNCDSTTGCAYAAWNTQGGCILYSSCKVTRTVASVTTTYHKANGMLEDDGEQCQCSFWTCVNDGGLGYCP